MAAIVESHGKRVVFGMTWAQLVQGSKQSSQVSALGRNAGAIYQVVWSSFGKAACGVVGAVPGSSDDKLVFVSGAVLFALVMATRDDGGDHLFVHDISSQRTGNDKYALIALVDGVPYLDRVVAGTSVEDKVRQLNQETGRTFKVHGKCASFPDADRLTIDDLMSQNEVPAILAKFKDNSKNKKLFALCVVLTIAAAAVELLTETKTSSRPAAQVKDPGAAYSNQVRQELATAAFTGNDALKSYWTRLEGRERVKSGYQRSKTVCGQGQCTETWARLDGGMESDFLSDPSVGCLTSAGATADELTSVCTVAYTPNALEHDDMPSVEDYWPTLQKTRDEMSLIGVAYGIAPAAITGVPKDVAAGNVPKSLAVMKGKETITGPLGLMVEILNSLPKNVAVQKLIVDESGDAEGANFTMEGEYYVKY